MAMTLIRWIGVSLLAATSACTGWGTSPDPASGGASTTVANILKLPEGFVLDHVGHVVADDARVYVSVTGTVDGLPRHALLRLSADGSGPVDAVVAKADSAGYQGWTAEPRLAVAGATLYWVRNSDKGTCELGSYASQSGSSPLTTLALPLSGSACVPRGIAVAAGSVFILTGGPDSCGYDFTGKSNYSPDCSSSSGLVRVTGTSIDELIPSGLSMNATLPNAILSDGQSVFWFTTMSMPEAEGGTGASRKLVSMDMQPKDGAVVPGALVLVATFENTDAPVGWTLRGTDIYVAVATEIKASTGTKRTGCRVIKVPAKGGSTSTILDDKSFTCTGFGAQATRGYVTGTRVQESDAYKWGAAAFELGSATGLNPFALDRDGLVLLDANVSGSRLVVSGPAYLLSLKKDALSP
jgi:hypothetical protein